MHKKSGKQPKNREKKPSRQRDLKPSNKLTNKLREILSDIYNFFICFFLIIIYFKTKKDKKLQQKISFIQMLELQ